MVIVAEMCYLKSLHSSCMTRVRFMLTPFDALVMKNFKPKTWKDVNHEAVAVQNNFDFFKIIWFNLICRCIIVIITIIRHPVDFNTSRKSVQVIARYWARCFRPQTKQLFPNKLSNPRPSSTDNFSFIFRWSDNLFPRNRCLLELINVQKKREILSKTNYYK